MTQKLVILCTHGPESPELATIPFVMATTAQASDMEVFMGFQADAVLLTKKGVIEQVQAPSFPPLKQLVEAYVEAGGKFYVCGPCAKARQINPETDLIENAKIVNAATFIKEISEAVNVLTY